MDILPTSWNNAISQYLPSEAGRQLFSLTTGRTPLAALGWPAACSATALVVIAIAAVLLVRRDA